MGATQDNVVRRNQAMRNTEQESPSTLVAILVAARRAGDRELEKDARWKLEERFGVKLSFARNYKRERGWPMRVASFLKSSCWLPLRPPRPCLSVNGPLVHDPTPRPDTGGTGWGQGIARSRAPH